MCFNIKKTERFHETKNFYHKLNKSGGNSLAINNVQQ